MSGIVIFHRGTSSPEPPYTLARALRRCSGRPERSRAGGSPRAPLRSRGSLAALARRCAASMALTSVEIGLVMQAREPEDKADQEKEDEHGHRDDLRREAKGGRERVR